MLNLNKNYVKKTERPHTIPAGATGQGEREKESKSRFSKLNFINAPLIKGARGILKVTLTSLIAALACTGIIYAATTVGTNITTTGTLDVTGVSTLTGDTSIAGTLDVTGNFTFTTASSTGIVKFPQINSDTGAISFGDENLTTTGDLSVANATTTGDFYATGTVKADKLRDRENIIPNYLYEDNGFDLISVRPHPGVVNPVLDKDDVTDVVAAFVADPFGFYENGTYYMFFEVMTQPNSQIGYATSSDGLTWTYGAIVLSDGAIAYSYPQVFKYNGTYYMIPSTSNTVVRIYTATTFPTTWTLSETITVAGGNDPSMFQWSGKWWLLACNSGTDNGYAYYSTIGPTGGTWTAHDNNPIISADNTKCRGAGRPIVKDDYIIYFYQKGDVVYGEKVRAYKITALTSSTFTETELTTSPILEPSSLETWRSTGMHTIDVLPSGFGTQGMALVDGHITSGTSVWSIGIYEVGTSGVSDNVPQRFGNDDDALQYYSPSENQLIIDLRTNGINAGLLLKTDASAANIDIDGDVGGLGVGASYGDAEACSTSGCYDWGMGSFSTLNDTDATSHTGSQFFNLLGGELTVTDDTGWTNAFLLNLRYNGATKASIATDGELTLLGDIVATGLEPSAYGSLSINSEGSPYGGTAVSIGTGTHTNSSGVITTIAISPTLNQSGTAGATDLLINRTETAVGSGVQLLADFQVGGVSKFNVSNIGVRTIRGATNNCIITIDADGVCDSGNALVVDNSIAICAVCTAN